MSIETINQLKAIKEIMEQVPTDRIDMDGIDGKAGCGCALYHFEARMGFSSPVYLDRKQGQYLFSTYHPGAYSPAIGQEAKDEFLRRVDEIIGELES